MSGSLDLHPGLVALMSEQGGVFTAAQARQFHHDAGHVRRLRDARVLTVLRRGVYAFRDSYDSADEEQRHRVRVAGVRRSLSGTVVFSHESAALLHGLALLEPRLDDVCVTRGAGAGSRREAGVRHHVAELLDSEVVESSEGLSVTSVARTAMDVARNTDRLECAVAAMDSALRLGVKKSELRSVLLRCRSWPGAMLAGTALDLADGRSANPGESWSRVALTREGVAPLDLQVPVYDEEGLIGYADFGWLNVLGEFDGKGKYGLQGKDHLAEVLWREKRREDRMRVGHEVVRWVTADLYRPKALADRVRAAQERARLRFPSDLRPA